MNNQSYRTPDISVVSIDATGGGIVLVSADVT